MTQALKDEVVAMALETSFPDEEALRACIERCVLFFCVYLDDAAPDGVGVYILKGAAIMRGVAAGAAGKVAAVGAVLCRDRDEAEDMQNEFWCSETH